MGKSNKSHNKTIKQVAQDTHTVTSDTKSVVGKGSKRFSREWILVMVAMALASFLIFFGIGKHYFWDDEANTAVVGQNMLATGSASAWNGRNMLSYGMKGSVDINMKKSSVPPVQYILAGLGYKLVGKSTGGLRAIFAVFGLLAILLATMWYKEEFGRSNWWMPALLLATSISYLLYVRQVRYYPLCLFFSFAFLYLWAILPKTRYPVLASIGTILCGGLLAGTHYLFAGALGFVVLVSMARKRYHNKRSYILLAVFISCTILATIIVNNYSPSTLRFAVDLSFNHLKRFLYWTGKGFLDTGNFEFIPLGMLLFAVVGFFLPRSEELKKWGNDYLFAWLYIIAMLAGCSFFSPQPGFGKTTDMRYYIDLIPLGAAATALTFELLAMTKRKWLPWLFIAIVISNNILYLNFFTKKGGVHCRLYQYLTEIVNPYPSTGGAIDEYITKHIDKDECLFMVPMYNNIIQMYYHPEQKFCGLVSNNAAFAKKHKDELREDLFFETAIPDYFMVGNRPVDRFQEFLDYVYGEGTYALVDGIPVYWREATRPEIPWRNFKPLTITNPQRGGTLIFKRTDKPAHFPTVSANVIERYIKF